MSGTPTETVVWLIRHPQPADSVRGLCYGKLDVPLAEIGVAQARAIAQALAAEPFAIVCGSPRRRCSQAAEIIAAGRACAVETIDALREFDFGEFEGRSYDEIAALYPDLYRQWMERPTETRFPGGEIFAEMRTRVTQAGREIRARFRGQSVALVTHGGVIRILLAEALGMQACHIFRIAQGWGAVNRIRYFGETALVELVNREIAISR